jgi:hypothetical protein
MKRPPVPSCRVEGREGQLRNPDTPLGIESVEACTHDDRVLRVYLLHPTPGAPPKVSEANVRIDPRGIPGGCAPELEHDPEWNAHHGASVLTVSLKRPGGPGRFRLALVEVTAAGRPGHEPLRGFDPLYSSADFTFDPASPGDDDEPPCPAADDGGPPPAIDYLAKDYQSFRELMLDRLASTLPGWPGRNFAADLWTTLVEILAYQADRLSYYQDAVAAEAYIQTARRRVSVRRHSRLVDYPMHDGCNARAWLTLQVDADTTLPDRVAIYTEPTRHVRYRPPVRRLRDLGGFEQSDRVVFEPMRAGLDGPIRLYAAHNRILFHSWGNSECHLPAGTTCATLVGRLVGDAEREGGGGAPVLHLRPGSLLLMSEVLGPWTGLPEDADPHRRHVVRLTRVEPAYDAVERVAVVNVAWDDADAVPFALCLSMPKTHDPVSVATANVVLADHGLTLDAAATDPVETLRRERAAGVPDPATGPDDGCLVPPLATPWPPAPVYRPLRRFPVTQAAPFPDARATATRQARWLTMRAMDVNAKADPGAAGARALRRLAARARGGCVLARAPIAPDADAPARPWADASGYLDLGPAAAAMSFDPEEAVASLEVTAGLSDPPALRWRPRRDLIDSRPWDRHVVAEVEDDGQARLRFGDGTHGLAPRDDHPRPPWVIYRLGSGATGNVGAGTLMHLVAERGPVAGVTVTNPLPARGGTEPEITEVARRRAPVAFRRQPRRAITPDDYARLAERHPAVQRAAAETFRLATGEEIHVAIDLLHGAERPASETAAIFEEILATLLSARRIGHDVAVVRPRFVPVDLAFRVWLKPTAFAESARSAVRRAIRGRLDEDALTFGQGIALSSLIAALHELPEVVVAQATRFERRDRPQRHEQPPSFLTIRPLEIAQLDGNARSLVLDVRGGR